MAVQQCLVIIKPDGLVKSLTGNILTALSETKLIIVGAKIVKVSREFAKKHYEHMKDKPFFEEIIDYITGKFHTDRVLALIYHGEDAIQKVRAICGETNPENAAPVSIRGRYGRIHSQTGVFENVVHASDAPETAEKEIKLWFDPDEVVEKIYKVKKVSNKEKEVEVWA
jgi:nucleoside-diphosphate kinase